MPIFQAKKQTLVEAFPTDKILAVSRVVGLGTELIICIQRSCMLFGEWLFVFSLKSLINAAAF